MTIRLAAPADIAVVQDISRRAYAAYEAEFGFVPLPGVEDYRPRIAGGEVWLLEEDGEVVGLVVLEEKPDHVLIFSVAVRPDRQSRGYGQALLAFAERRAGELSVSEVRLFTNERMTRNLAIYERWGFVRTGTRQHPGRADVTFVDMAKAVQPAQA